MKNLILIMGCPNAGQDEITEYIISKKPQATQIKQKDLINNDYNIINKELKNKDLVIYNGYLTTLSDRDFLFNKIEIIDDLKIIGIWVENSWTNIKNLNKEKNIEELASYFKYRNAPIGKTYFYDIAYITKNVNIGINKRCPKVTTISNCIDRLLAEC